MDKNLDREKWEMWQKVGQSPSDNSEPCGPFVMANCQKKTGKLGCFY